MSEIQSMSFKKLRARASSASCCSPRRVYGWHGGASIHSCASACSSVSRGTCAEHVDDTALVQQPSQAEFLPTVDPHAGGCNMRPTQAIADSDKHRITCASQRAHRFNVALPRPPAMVVLVHIVRDV